MDYPSKEEIEKAKTPKGGWTRKQLEAWGVPWPPPKGWRKELIRQADANDRKMRFEHAIHGD